MVRAGLLALAALIGTPASAAVYEVDDDGAMTRLDTPPPVRPVAVRVMVSPGAAARAQAYGPFVTQAATRYEVSPALIDAIAHTESRYNQSAVSRARAAGIMQLMPQTARALGVNSADAQDNIRGGAAYLRVLLNRFDGDVVRTIAAYNAGPAAVIRAGGVPRIPETQAYVAAVLAHLAASAQ